MYKSEIHGKGGIYAKVVEDSIADNGVRLTTMELNYPRFIHSEFMTHRVFSRNASSSRAIPVEKMLQQVEEDPASPIYWGENIPGMQAGQEIDDKELATAYWYDAAWCAASSSRDLQELNLHKQVTNRLLEPFQFIKVVCTATEWNNFFNLRDHDAAQPEIHELATVMKSAMAASTPSLLLPGQWHTPYSTENNKKEATAKCARVSYKNHDSTETTLEKDIGLHDMLLKMGHMSPFEHCATPMTNEYDGWEEGATHRDRWGNTWSGNLRGWIQYRQMV